MTDGGEAKHDGRVSQTLEVLRRVFGYHGFRGQQQEIVEQVAGGGDALVLMPTGGGKSLCYQIPSIVRSGVGVVVSPLIALMQDQVSTLRELGVRAAALHSAMELSEIRAAEAAALRGELELVYVSPERLLKPRTLEFLARVPLALFAIDEAHCVSQWGHDFRPEYLQLGCIPEHFPGVPRVALTATADEPTRREILQRLRLDEARVFISGFDRPNIRYRLVAKAGGRQQLLSFIRSEHPEDAGIVYCMSRRKVEDVAAFLEEHGVRALAYHAGLDQQVRARNQERFLMEEGLVMVATIAFGMGIDKPDVRFVAHLDAPKSLEAYYQETGRAGRDGLAADAWMTYGYADVVALRQRVAMSELSEERKRVENLKLNALLGYCETATCRRQVLLRYFGDTLEGPCGNCDTCLEPVATWDGTVAAQKALSCVWRTGQRFGASYLADVLTGADDERIDRYGHRGLSTYGIGKELTRPQWLSVYRQMVACGLVTVDDEHGSLLLSDAARPVLKGESKVRLRHDPAPAKKLRRTRDKRRALSEDLTDPKLRALFARLREKRAELAKAHNVPPYVIFHDTTLLEMVHARPRRLEEMAGISGVGGKKLQRYGEAFLEVLQGEGRA